MKIEHEFIRTSLGGKCSCGSWIIFGDVSNVDVLFEEHSKE